MGSQAREASCLTPTAQGDGEVCKHRVERGPNPITCQLASTTRVPTSIRHCSLLQGR